MIQCYNSHISGTDGDELFKKEEKFVSSALCLELERYCNKHREDIVFDINQIMEIFPVALLYGWSNLGIDVPVFIQLEFEKLYKMCQSDEEEKMNIFDNVIFWYIMQNSNSSVVMDNRQLIDAEVNDYLKEMSEESDLTSSHNRMIAEELYGEVFKNLSTIFHAEENGDITLLYLNYDFKVFLDMDVKDAIIYLNKANYDNLYYEMVFESIGFEVPFQIIEVLENNSKADYMICLKDENKNTGNGFIIDFPFAGNAFV